MTARAILRIIAGLSLATCILPLKLEENHQEQVFGVDESSPASASACTQDQVSAVIDEYRDVVSDYLNFHQGTWMRHVGLSRDTEHGSLHTKNEGGPRDALPDRPPASCAQDSKQTVDGIVWDDEDDIGDYFDELLDRCTDPLALDKDEEEAGGDDGEYEDGDEDGYLVTFVKQLYNRDNDDDDVIITTKKAMTAECNAVNVEKLERCFGYMIDLIHIPRCTVRLDSHTRCRSSKADETTVTTVLEKHHIPEALNIIIIGAGPVGLAQAGMLAAINEANGTQPIIRVTVFENRLDAGEPGRKKPYSRNWGTELWFLCGVVDKRICKICQALYSHENVSNFPINALETLLLLSNRDKGVKFIYDDYQNYSNIIRNIENLIIFDATGHRLDQLKISWNISIRDYTPSNETMVYSPVSISDFNLLSKHGQQPRVGMTENQLTFPVQLGSDLPYRLNYAKIIGFFGGDDVLEEIWGIMDRDKGNHPPLCSVPGKSDSYRSYCGPHFFYNAAANYRQSAQWALLKESERSFNAGDNDIFQMLVPIHGVVFNLTPDQETALRHLVDEKQDKTSTEKEMLLDEIPTSYITENPEIFDENVVGELLLTLKKYEATGKMSVFSCQPYMYSHPIGKDLGLGATVLRIGDSLWTGDVNAASGLANHLYIIGELHDRLIDKWKEQGT